MDIKIPICVVLQVPRTCEQSLQRPLLREHMEVYDHYDKQFLRYQNEPKESSYLQIHLSKLHLAHFRLLFFEKRFEDQHKCPSCLLNVLHSLEAAINFLQMPLLRE